MTPEERNLVTELFDRLATLEDAPRDRDAERMVQDGLGQAPNAPYALVQTVLIQDEALKRADARIRQLEAERGPAAEPPRPASFLESMRESVWGRRDTPRSGSVPTVRPGAPASDPTGAPSGYPSGTSPSVGAQPMGQPYGGQPYGQPYGGQPYGQPYGGSGGSFLGTAAATAVGVIGSSLLLRALGGHGGTAHAAVNPPSGGSPWGGSGGSGGGIGSGSNSELAKQAGLNDIGRSGGSRDDSGAGRGYGLTDGDASNAADDRNQGRHASENDENYQAEGGRYSAEDDDQDFGEMDEGDFGGDGGDDQ